MNPDQQTEPPSDVRVLITAAEVYPEMERAFLNARHEIWASYRIFDLATKLRTPEAKEIGSTWFDLIVHTLRRGVRLNMVLSDFDPIMTAELHGTTWKSMRAFVAASEAAGPDAPLKVTAAIHPSRVGRPLRLVLWPFVRRRLKRILAGLNEKPLIEREQILATMPGLRTHVKRDRDGYLKATHWPPADMLPATHHQKIAVFDRETLCVGGLDLNERRYDDKGHHRSRDETWHDVQVMTTDRGYVEEAQRHLETFLDVTAGLRKPEPSHDLLLTLSRKRKVTMPFIGPKPLVTALRDAHLAQVRRAEKLIYLETQFFRDTGLAQELAAAGRNNPELEVILILPAAPEDIAFYGNTGADAKYGEYLQAKCLGILEDAFGDRIAMGSPVRPETIDQDGRDTSAGSPIIYVHAKVSIFDTTSAIVSSANLNGRSFNWDTEAGVMIENPETVRYLRHRAFCHWLCETPEDAFHLPGKAAASWRRRCGDNLSCAPHDRRGFLVTHDRAPAQKIGRPLPGIPESMV